jgi:hypothetical protein
VGKTPIDLLDQERPSTSPIEQASSLGASPILKEEIDAFNIEMVSTPQINNIRTISDESLGLKIDRILAQTSIDKPKKASINSLNNYLSNFISDSGSTVYIIADSSYFYSFTKDNTIKVSWGDAKTINIYGFGNIYLKFKDTNKKLLLRNCYYIPKLGVNIISTSVLEEDIYSIYNKYTISLVRNNQLITSGDQIKGLYYLLVEVLHLQTSINTILVDTNLLYKRFVYISPNSVNKLIDNTIQS